MFCPAKRLLHNDGRCLACRNTDGPLPVRPVDRCCLPTGPVPRLARLRRTGLGGIVGYVFPALLDEDSGIFKQRGWYADRRSLQIAASIAVAVVVMALVVWDLLWPWHRIKRYRLAVGFAGPDRGLRDSTSSPLPGYRRWPSPGSAPPARSPLHRGGYYDPPAAARDRIGSSNG
jgi:hypothetical protein